MNVLIGFLINSNNINFASEIDIQTFEQVIFPSSNLNPGSFTIVDAGNPAGLANSLGYPGSFAYQVKIVLFNNS